MRLGLCKAFAAVLYFGAVLVLTAKEKEIHCQGSGAEMQDVAQSAAQSAYPESVEALKYQLQDLLAAVKASDTSKSSALRASFSIPNHEEWFLKTFGSSEGARLEAKYKELESQSGDWLKRRIELNVKEGRTRIVVQSVNKPDDTPMRLMRVVSGALVQPTTIYMVSVNGKADDKSPYYLGDFVFVQGGFRYLERQVLQALSTAPPMRLTIGGNVQRAKLMNRVEPLYPPDASAAKIGGTVALHVIIGVDGTVQQIQVLTGHPLLVQSAIDAVKQWRYQPTLLNGMPVEVDTQIDVIYSTH